MPIFRTPLALERHAWRVCTKRIFYEIQEEISGSYVSCRVVSVDEVDGNLRYGIHNKGNAFNVLFTID